MGSRSAIRPTVTALYPAIALVTALDALETGRIIGKVALKIEKEKQ